jgi:hypothetical protein
MLLHYIMYNRYIKGWLDEDNSTAMHDTQVHNIKRTVNYFAHCHFTATVSVKVRLNSKCVPEGGDLTEYTMGASKSESDVVVKTNSYSQPRLDTLINKSNSQWLQY